MSDMDVQTRIPKFSNNSDPKFFVQSPKMKQKSLKVQNVRMNSKYAWRVGSDFECS